MFYALCKLLVLTHLVTLNIKLFSNSQFSYCCIKQPLGIMFIFFFKFWL